MNREKHLNEARRKRQLCLNDSAIHNADCSHTVDISNTAVKSKPHCQQRIPHTDGYDGFASTRLNSMQLNAEANSVSGCDLFPFLGHEAGVFPSELYQQRTVSSNDDYQRHQTFSNKEKKKRKNYRINLDRTNSPSIVVPVSTEDGAAGFMDRQMRSTHQRTTRQSRIDMQHNPSSALQNDLFYNDDAIDHASAAAAIAASILASEKVFSLKCIAFLYTKSELWSEVCRYWKFAFADSASARFTSTDNPQPQMIFFPCPQIICIYRQCMLIVRAQPVSRGGCKILPQIFFGKK